MKSKDSVDPWEQDKCPDLHHPFQCEWGRESECSFFHSWLGGLVKCALPESHPHHKPPFPVAPGEAQREPTPLQSSGGTKCSDCGHDEAVHEDGCTVSWRETSPAGFRKNYQCPCEKFVPAVPSEVAPSQAQKEKTPMKHEVVEDRNQSGDYRVEAIDSNNDGDVFTAIFVGPDAELRAKEYAQWKNQ